MFRRLATVSAVASLAVLSSCSSLRDAFSAHADVVARAAGQELTVSRLAELIGPQKQVPLRREVVDRIADLWVDYQLLAQALARGDSLTDTATVLAASWPAVTQRLADHLHDSLIDGRALLTDAQVDSAFLGGEERWLEHILVQVPADTSPEFRASKRRSAEGYLAQLRRGTPFAQLAARSDDQMSAQNGGSLGLVARGVLVRAFEDAAWQLGPGETSGIVETAFGFHIIRRPDLAEVRDSFRVAYRQLVIARLDSIFLDSLANRTNIRVRGSAPALVRSAAADLRSAKGSARTIATFRGGRLRMSDFARWLQAFPTQTRALVGQAPDSTIAEFVKSIARNEILVRMVRDRDLRLAPAERDSIIERYRLDFGLLATTIGVSPDSLAADTAAQLDRTAAAARRVDAYFAAITASPPQRQFVEVPAFLADMLRERLPWSISPAGVDRAVERARELRGPETPTGVGNPLTPAPGGPPMGGGAQTPPPRSGDAPPRR